MFVGKFGGGEGLMGICNREDQRIRSMFIQVSLSVRDFSTCSKFILKYIGEEVVGVCFRNERRVIVWHLLLTVNGGGLPHAFIKPPRKIGIYVISHCLKTGKFYTTLLALNKTPFIIDSASAYSFSSTSRN